MIEPVYLGGMLACHGKATREVSRRLGEGPRVLEGLARVWSHSRINRSRKVNIYMSMTVPKVLYSLESLWLLQADLRRIDAFHCKCLRKVLRIPTSYVSGVPNSEVLRLAGQTFLSSILAQKQVTQYKRIMQMPAESFVKRLVCNSQGAPIQWNIRRGRGRPGQLWCHSVHKLFIESCPDHERQLPEPGDVSSIAMRGP